MHTVLVRVCPNQGASGESIQRIMRTESPVPCEGGKFFVAALGRDLDVFLRPREKPATAECAIWCSATQHDIVFLRGAEPDLWEPAFCQRCQ